MLLAFERYGMLGGAIAVGALRHGDRPAVIDERGELSYRDLDRHANAIANAWRRDGLEPGEGVAILVRNHRGFLESVFAAAKCGARIVLLNTSFAGPQIREVATREGHRPTRLRRRVQRGARGDQPVPRTLAGMGRCTWQTTRSTR